MKRLWCLVLLSLCGSPALAQDPETVFIEGNQEYQNGSFAAAAEKYESLVANGYESGPLYYNLGNAAFKSGNIARAILNYERGLRLMPDDGDLRHNLELSKLMTVDRIEAVPRLFIWDYWDSIKTFFSPEGALWLTYAGYAGLFLSLSVLLLGRSYLVRKGALLAAGFCGLFFLTLAAVTFARYADLADVHSAIVMEDIATIKNSPEEGSSDAFVLHAGVKVRLLDRVGEWVMVRIADGKVGWMKADGVEVI